MYDVAVIGAGVTGCAIARELAKYQLDVVVIEKASDVCEGTSKANSGIVHAGFDAEPGSLKAKLNVEGSRRMEALSKELDFHYANNGSLVLMFDEEDRDSLQALYDKGLANGVEGLQILTPEQVHEMEPHITDKLAGALYAPTAGIVCPFGLTIALAENAYDNGVIFEFNQEVFKIERQELGNLFRIWTTDYTYEARVVINAAGVYADAIHEMATGEIPEQLKIVARRGQYMLMDKTEGHLVHSTIFQLPTKMGKGILVTPTVHGNLLVGPTAEDIEDKEGTNTTSQGLEGVLEKGSMSVPALSSRKVITSFSGLRAHSMGNDFYIQKCQEVPGFIDVAGIESPGLSCAPVIGEYVVDIVKEIMRLIPNPKFKAFRKGVPNMALASKEEREALIAQDPSYAKVICRCELVTEGEIRNAIRRSLGAKTLDGIKRRTRAGMGRCQAGFCSPKTVEILAQELNVSPEEITKCGGDSYFLDGVNKEVEA
ncbi:MAG: NAD(P)/FAD-dependent oxidoreductase [Lachnospiraceae bacterium]|nr:NAD(P)/FAD-dependent oxidoreductase [Lachnospiraceae bacterium]